MNMAQRTIPSLRGACGFTALYCFVGIALVLLAGCGMNSNRESVEGTVTLDGKPLSEGLIQFIPQQGTGGPSAGAGIAEGRFSIARDKSIFPGKFRVEITAARKTGRKIESPIAPGRFADETVQYLPARYNLQSELTAEVTAGGSNQFEFELTSK